MYLCFRRFLMWGGFKPSTDPDPQSWTWCLCFKCRLFRLIVTSFTRLLTLFFFPCCPAAVAEDSVFKLSGALSTLTQADSLIGSALSVMSLLHIIRALTNSLGDTLEETQLVGGTEWVRRPGRHGSGESEIRRAEKLKKVTWNTLQKVPEQHFSGFFYGRQNKYLWRFVLFFLCWFSLKSMHFLKVMQKMHFF